MCPCCPLKAATWGSVTVVWEAMGGWVGMGTLEPYIDQRVDWVAVVQGLGGDFRVAQGL